MLAGIAVNCLGHCHPAVVSALSEQARQLVHCSNLYYIRPQARLAKLLVDSCDMDRVLFVNSGTEAVESAMKLARMWATKNGRGGKIITMEGSFHGRSLAAVCATGQPKYRKGFDPLPTGFQNVPFNDVDALRDAIGPDTCAIMLEPVQGEGGIVAAGEDYLRRVRHLCDEHGLLLIFDEIQCGMGRVGSLFAYQRYGVIPDMITIAKALGGGVPIGALLAKERVASAFTPGTHGTTFGGNPLATAAALATVSVLINEDLPGRARDLGDYLMDQLRRLTRDIPMVKEIRGLGLMVGIALDREAAPVIDLMRARGVLANATNTTVVRLVPPLIISRSDLDRAIEVIIDCLKEVSSRG